METGIGKTERFLRLLKEGKRIVFLVPTLMLKFNLERDTGGAPVFTFDSIRGGDKPHKMRADLLFQLINADVVVVDEAHCLDLHYNLKPPIMDELNDTLRRVATKKPVFFLTATPSVNQILTITAPNRSKIVSYLRKDMKNITVETIAKEGIESVIKNHDRILIFIDDKRQINTLSDFIEKHIKTDHTIFIIHGDIKSLAKKRTEQEIQETGKWIILGTSSVVSGINIQGLQTIVFSCRIINQPDLFQCMGRLRIVNDLDRIHPLYIMNMNPYRNPKARIDQFEFLSPGVIISYLAKLYHITQTITCDSKIGSFTRLKNFEDWKNLIKSVRNIREYYALSQVQEQKLFWIPTDIIRDLNKEGFFHDNPHWFNIPVKSVLYKHHGDKPDHRAIVELRNRDMGIYNSSSHYFDPYELYPVVAELRNKKHYTKRLPEAVDNILKSMNSKYGTHV
jgi:hypothetical protein